MIEVVVLVLVVKVCWFDVLFEWFDGVVVGNEVFDVMLVWLFVKVDGVWCECGVVFDVWYVFVFDDWLVGVVGLLVVFVVFDVGDGYVIEMYEVVFVFMCIVCMMFGCGVVLLVDYGFFVYEYYYL